MKSETTVKTANNQAQSGKPTARKIKIKSGVKAGESPDFRIATNHNQTFATGALS